MCRMGVWKAGEKETETNLDQKRSKSITFSGNPWLEDMLFVLDSFIYLLSDEIWGFIQFMPSARFFCQNFPYFPCSSVCKSSLNKFSEKIFFFSKMFTTENGGLLVHFEILFSNIRWFETSFGNEEKIFVVVAHWFPNWILISTTGLISHRKGLGNSTTRKQSEIFIRPLASR